MHATHEDLIEVPQLAVLDALHSVLDSAVALVVVQHPEIAENDGLVGLPPEVWVADHLAVAMRDLQRLILRYREAALDDSRYRMRMHRFNRGPITPPTPPGHAA